MTTITSQSRTNLGPLTTTFTPPASCFVGYGICSGCNIAYLGQFCDDSGPFDGSLCWPETSKGAPENAPGFDGRGFYSPGTICPSGYVSACGATAGGESDWVLQFPMTASETAIGCCPAGFACTNQQNSQTCIQTRISPTSKTVICNRGTTTTDSGILTASAAGSALVLYAPLIQLVWQSSDLVAKSTGGSSTIASGTGTSTTPGATGPLDSNSFVIADQGSSGGGLVAGAVAGIAVGVAVLVLGVAFAAFWVWRKKRSQQHQLHADPIVPPSDGTGSVKWPSEMAGCQHQPHDTTMKLGNGQAPNELDTQLSVAEMSSQPVYRTELPA